VQRRGSVDKETRAPQISSRVYISDN
jgi:hypothetical protein